jgi:dTDP-4-dehydrorhamnose 3,5-epimerase
LILKAVEVEGVQIPGAALIVAEPIEDDRGYFARLWSDNEAAEIGWAHDFTQLNEAFNHTQGTLRGMHFQSPPAAETKLVRVLAGAVWDVLLDLRESSPTYLRWRGFELSADDHQALMIPIGCAHGYQTLQDRTKVMYQTTHRYVREAASGVKFDDPAFGIVWPLPVTEISAADATWNAWRNGDSRSFKGSL